MFDFLSLTLKNFKSYKGEHILTFPEEPGLYYIKGENGLFGSNGAGKSTLLDAIYWCFFGRTLRDLRGPDIISRGEETAEVTIEFLLAENQHTITRRQSPNALLLDNVQVEQEAINKLLRLTPDSFVHSIISVPQYGESFFELTAGAKLNLFSTIMNLDFWTEKAKEASTEVIALDKRIIVGNAKLEAVKEHILVTKQQIENLTKKDIQQKELIKSFEKTKKSEIAELENAIKKLAENNLKGKNQLKEVRNKKAVLEKKNFTADKLLKDIDSKLRSLSENLVIYQTKNSINDKEIRDFSKLKGQCPHCQQNVSTAHIKKKIAEIEIQIKSDIKEMDEISNKQDTLLNHTLSIEEGMTSNKAILHKLDVEEQKLNLEIKNSIDEIQRSNKRLDELKAEKPPENPITDLLIEANERLQDSLKQDKTFTSKLKTLESDKAAFSYWINGFKKIRLFVIDDALKALEIEINNNLAAFGMSQWLIELGVERENKAGGVTKGFTVAIKSPDSDRPVRWEAWSGGEAQRLQLAGDLGLANLIMLQAGLEGRIEFFDEPTKHMSREGFTDLAEALHARAIEAGKKVFLIDHHNIEFGDFAGILNISKDSAGSSFEWQ